MIHAALGRRVPVELTAEAFVQRRVARLAVVSLIALGLITGLAAATLDAPLGILASLAIGWALMPAVLTWSLKEPRVRYLVTVPASMVTIGLLGICLVSLPASIVAATGWLLMTAGVGLGGVLGLWFWFRVLPVPAGLDSPQAAGRWALIGAHVAPVVLGWALAATALSRGG